MSAINDEMTFVSRDCKSILDICDRISAASQKVLANDKTRLRESSQLSLHLSAKDHHSDLYNAAKLQDVPVLARVVCKDETNRTRIFYVTPCAPPAGLARANLASIYETLGRLAVLPLASSLVAPKGESLVVTEKTLLKPVDYLLKRDIFDSLFESLHRDRLRVKSLRDFLRVFGEQKQTDASVDGDEPPIVPQEELDIVVDEGEIRPQNLLPFLTQPHLLDMLQDEILRRPFQTKQVILGSPGTGKTSTLIKRLDFMISSEALEAEQAGLFEKLNRQAGMAQATSWFYFVPTDLLRRYVGDSFADLVIPGFEENVKTWDEMRLELATNYFRILSPKKNSGLSLSETPDRLSKAAKDNTVGWYEDFSAYQRQAYFQTMKVQAKLLASAPQANLAALGGQLLELLEISADHTLAWFQKALYPFQEDIAAEKSSRTQSLKDELKSSFHNITQNAPSLISGLLGLVSEAQAAPEKDGSQVDEILKNEARRIYAEAMQEYALNLAKGRQLPRESRSAKVLAWLGEGRLLPVSRLTEMGQDLLVCRSLSRFKVDSPAFLNSYFGCVLSNYLLFRRRNKLWYNQNVRGGRHIHPLEADLLLLSFLDPGADILRHRKQNAHEMSGNWSLANHSYVLRNQVLIDELTDFTPVQLKCMASLADQEMGSVSAAGDLALRTSANGLRSLDDLEWALPKAVLTELSINYRQSQTLSALTESLADAAKPRFLSHRFNDVGPKIALARNVGSLADAAKWLADRIAEVVQRSGKLPSTAVLVAKPSEITPLTEALTKALEPQALKAVSARDGQIWGHSPDVRVLTIDKARGMEFEAAFVVNPDDLLKTQPELCGRFLYLAASRAVTYLGFSFRAELPPEMESLAYSCAADWSQSKASFEVGDLERQA
ncbi:MAG: hypothetical protein LBJ64_04860 [Deltaproteobacteria bacterium]|jgi:hypothetical protein|nr:hypothetical protein [Deltaproteobacteria bacterium]